MTLKMMMKEKEKMMTLKMIMAKEVNTDTYREKNTLRVR